MSRRRKLARRNPDSPVVTALTYLGWAAAIGGSVGAVGGSFEKPTADPLGGAVGGASIGVGVTALGGFIIGLVQAEHRNAGFATAGIGWGALILANLATSVAANSAKALP